MARAATEDQVQDTISEAEKAQLLAEANQGSGNREEPQNTTKLSDLEGVSFEDSPGIVSMDQGRPMPMTPQSGQPVSSGDVGEWGPYGDYHIVNTGFGEYGIEKGKILFFVVIPTFNRKTGVFEDRRFPRYRAENQSREDALAEFEAYQASRPVRG